VPAGEFSMGRNGGDDPDENPAHTVNLSEFWIDKTEVTNAMYAMCVTDGKCSPPRKTSFYLSETTAIDNYYGSSQYADHPVVYVSWESANNYCTWTGKRLPTEAEWEKAARGTDGRLFPWGSDAPTCERAKSFDCPPTGAIKVGSLPSGVSPYGALDMVGNVWEWVADFYSEGTYLNSPAANPTGPSSGNADNQHVVRGGGSFTMSSKITDFSASARSFGNLVDNRPLAFFTTGFRCARSITP
jgi:formylglycine-generating enzyme required for sulfatase activity